MLDHRIFQFNDFQNTLQAFQQNDGMLFFIDVVEERSKFIGSKNLIIDTKLLLDTWNCLQIRVYFFIGTSADLPIGILDSDGKRFDVLVLRLVLLWTFHLNYNQAKAKSIICRFCMI